MAYLLSRNIRIEEGLVDHPFNSGEKRLARILPLPAHLGKGSNHVGILIPKINRETPADMVGTTRSGVSMFINKFRKLGMIDYNRGLKIHSSLLNVVLRDQVSPHSLSDKFFQTEQF